MSIASTSMEWWVPAHDPKQLAEGERLTVRTTAKRPAILALLVERAEGGPSQLLAMLRNLLRDGFQLRVHTETHDMPTYGLS